MLVSLHVKNLALIDEEEIFFDGYTYLPYGGHPALAPHISVFPHQ